MNSIREIEKINEEELKRGIAGTSASWHQEYAKSPWVYVGNLDHSLSEGDVICVMSQFGEIEDFHLVREEDTGKSRGFGFVKYEDSRSCILAVDNFTGVKLCGRSMRVDHVLKYRLPKNLQEKEEQANSVEDFGPGHAYKDRELENKYSLEKGRDLFAPAADDDSSSESDDEIAKINKASSSPSKDKEAKRKRKEDRARRRKEKEERRQRREEKRQKKEDRKKRKRI